MLRKTVILLLVIMLAGFVLCACGNETKNDPTEASEIAQSKESLTFLLEPVIDSDAEIDADKLSEVKTVLEARLSDYDCNIKVDADSGQVVVNIFEDKSAVGGEVDKEYVEILLTPVGRMTICSPDGEVLMDNADVEEAEATVYPIDFADDSAETADADYAVVIGFTKEGAEKFAEITNEYMNQELSFFLDDELICSPTVQAPITDGEAILSGDLTSEQVTKIAGVIAAPPLPFPMTIISGPSDGQFSA